MKQRTMRLWALAGLLFLLVLTAAGCRGAAKDESTGSDEPVSAGGGALLWEQNCGRCHYYRTPKQRSDGEWAIIVHHMRVRANLTADEHRKILRFLQSAN